jgi:hypothetical protein
MPGTANFGPLGVKLAIDSPAGRWARFPEIDYPSGWQADLTC